MEEQLPPLEEELLRRVSGALRDGGAGLGSRGTSHPHHLDPWKGFCTGDALRDGPPLGYRYCVGVRRRVRLGEEPSVSNNHRLEGKL